MNAENIHYMYRFVELTRFSLDDAVRHSKEIASN